MQHIPELVRLMEISVLVSSSFIGSLHIVIHNLHVLTFYSHQGSEAKL